MKRAIPIILMLLPFSVVAQYRGGVNDGVSSLNVTLQNSFANIYKGGNNDGVASSQVINQNSFPNIFLGGNNDGVAIASVPLQNSFANIYAGGVNDGAAIASLTNTNSFANIYVGGINDGAAISSLTNQNSFADIYVGGVNDGAAFASVINNNAIPAFYKGGASDGYTIAFALSQNLAVPLPIEILQFDGRWVNEDALLQWKTGTPVNLDHFELERSVDGGVSFGTIISLDPNTPQEPQEYGYTDAQAYKLQADFLLYRLKCFDTKGSFKYSAIVRLAKDRTAPVIIAYPNPTTGQFTLSLQNVTNLNGYSYMLTTIDGKLIKRENITNPITSFNLRSYATATYHLSIYKDGYMIQHFSILLTQ